jgi:antibiotic biosynthesis monooxygenase (ABM) superfamily enzyme
VSPGADASVTVIVTRTVRRGCTAAYEAWLRGVGAAAGAFPGHLGLTVLRPPAEGREHTLVFRFDTVAHLRAWEDSPVRRVWVARAEALCERAHRQQAMGLEAWFSLPAGSDEGRGPRTPPRWKMALVSWLVAFPTVQVLNATLGRWMAPVPGVVRGAGVGAGLILVMTYAAMPLATRVCARWLYPGEPISRP